MEKTFPKLYFLLIDLTVLHTVQEGKEVKERGKLFTLSFDLISETKELPRVVTVNHELRCS